MTERCAEPTNHLDYSRYTLDQLYDVRKWLDEQRYPERAALLHAEIARQEAARLLAPARQELPSTRLRIFRDLRTLGIYMVVAGSISFAMLLDTVRRENSVPPAFLLIGFFLYGSLIFTGTMTLLGTRGWLSASLIVWVLQVPSFQCGHLRYSTFTTPTFEIKLWPDVGFFWSTNATLQIRWYEEWQPFYLGLNAVAVAAAALLADRLAEKPPSVA